jgi:hypothetical protein
MYWKIFSYTYIFRKSGFEKVHSLSIKKKKKMGRLTKSLCILRRRIIFTLERFKHRYLEQLLHRNQLIPLFIRPSSNIFRVISVSEKSNSWRNNANYVPTPSHTTISIMRANEKNKNKYSVPAVIL